MALETLTGEKFIDDLVETNPVNTDVRGEGDDHLRGIKNVIQNSIANFGSGPCIISGSDSGGDDDYVITSGRSFTAYNTRMLVCLTITTASAGAPTLNIDSIGLKNIVDTDSVAATAEKMPAGTHLLQYDGTNFVLQSAGLTGDIGFYLMGGTNTVIGTGVTVHSIPNINGDNSVTTGIDDAEIIMPEDCTITGFRCQIRTNSNSSGNTVITMMKDGVATAIAVTVSAGTTTVQTDASSVSFSQDERMSIKIDNSSGNSSVDRILWGFLNKRA